MPRTPKRQWVSERCWGNKGSLVGAKSRLRQIARAHSTLPTEAELLNYASNVIDRVLATWDEETRRTASLKQFLKRIGGRW